MYASTDANQRNRLSLFAKFKKIFFIESFSLKNFGEKIIYSCY